MVASSWLRSWRHGIERTHGNQVLCETYIAVGHNDCETENTTADVWIPTLMTTMLDVLCCISHPYKIAKLIWMPCDIRTGDQTATLLQRLSIQADDIRNQSKDIDPSKQIKTERHKACYAYCRFCIKMMSEQMTLRCGLGSMKETMKYILKNEPVR